MAKKTVCAKTLFTKDNYKMALNVVRNSGEPYTVTRSNYTLKIESDILNIYFMTSKMSRLVFPCSAMIVKDLKNSGIETPEINKSYLKYFAFNEHEILQRANGRVIYNIDIKSAYANALNNYNVLTEKTFSFLCSLDKKERLAAVGKLAATKDVFKFDGKTNKAISDETITSETEGWFYFCVLEIQNLMLQIKEMIGSDFLFYWVDGVFFTNIEHAEMIQNFLIEKGYKSSFDICQRFKFYQEENQKYIEYYKENSGKTMCEFKRLNLPVMNRDIKDFVLRFCGIVPNSVRITKNKNQ